MVIKADGRQWLVARYLPCALFALKASNATSSVGRTLLVPTPYSIKMALVEAAFTAGLADDECALLLRTLARVKVRVAPPRRAVVVHTFLKIRQEPKNTNSDHPYISSIGYREFVFHQGELLWAFDLSGMSLDFQERIRSLLPFIRYIGKRGSFIQFAGSEWRSQVDVAFTQPIEGDTLLLPLRSHIVPLDDTGPEADLETLSPYSPKRASVGHHRVFTNTIVPLGLVNTGPGFTEYRTD